MVLEDTGSELYLSKSGKGFVVKCMKDYRLWSFFVTGSMKELAEFVEGKRSRLFLKTLMGRADSEPE